MSGTTIFTVMSALAQQHGAVNLGQGFPDFDCDPQLLDAVDDAMRRGLNQYPPMAGVPQLREAVAAKIEALYGQRYDAASEITITAGATQAILSVILAIVHPGDEVIVLEPAYDSYEPNIVLAGGTAVHVPLDAGTFRPNFDAIAARALAAHARDHRQHAAQPERAPSGRAADMQRLAELLRPTDVLVIADEVYEHMVYDGARHESVSRYPELAARSFVVSSFGKTYHVTGWKVGYVAAPAPLTAELRKVHQFNVFTVNTPMQHALASLHGRPGAAPRPGGVLPAQARPVSRRARRDAPARAAERGQLLPVRRLLGASATSTEDGVLRMADARDRRRRDPVVGVLSRRLRATHRAPVLREEGRDARSSRSSGWRRSEVGRGARRSARTATSRPARRLSPASCRSRP